MSAGGGRERRSQRRMAGGGGGCHSGRREQQRERKRAGSVERQATCHHTSSRNRCKSSRSGSAGVHRPRPSQRLQRQRRAVGRGCGARRLCHCRRLSIHRHTRPAHTLWRELVVAQRSAAQRRHLTRSRTATRSSLRRSLVAVEQVFFCFRFFLAACGRHSACCCTRRQPSN